MQTALRITRHIRCIESIIKKFWMLSAKKTVSRIPAAEAVYLRDAILKKAPEITEEQLRIIWRELPFVLEKRTQEWIEREKQFSENYIRKHR